MMFGELMKKIFLFIIPLVLCTFLLSAKILPSAYAQTPATSQITYFVFGDSISEGTVLEENNSSHNTENRFTNVLTSNMEKLVSSVDYQNYAIAGHKLEDFVNVYNSTENLDTASIVTLDIGPNNILGPATDTLLAQASNIGSFMNMSNEEIVNYLMQEVDAAMSEGAQYFADNFEQDFLNFLSKLDDNANVYVMNIYNPYKELSLRFKIDFDLEGFLQVHKDINLPFGDKTNEYLNENEICINSTIEKAIQSINENPQVTQKVTLVDVKGAFENYYTANGIDEYRSLILTKDEAINSQDVPLTVASIANITYLIDPHPTDKGHALIAQTFWGEMSGACTPENFEITHDGEALSQNAELTYLYGGNLNLTSTTPLIWKLGSIVQSGTTFNIPFSSLQPNTQNVLKVYTLNGDTASSVYYIYNLTSIIDASITIDNIDKTLGNFNNYYTYTLNANFENKNNIPDDLFNIVWTVDGKRQSSSGRQLTYTPSRSGTIDVSVSLLYDGQEVAKSATTFVAEKNQTTISAISHKQLSRPKPNQYPSYELAATVVNSDNLELAVVWYSGAQKIDVGETISYTPTEDDVNVYAILEYEGEEIVSSRCDYSFVANKGGDIKVSQITFTEEKIPGDYSTYTFKATVQNPENYDVKVVWYVNNQKEKDGETITYTPTQDNVNLYAILEYEGEEIASSRCDYSFVANKSSNILVSQITYTEEKTPSEYSTYTFTAKVENQDNFDVIVAWYVNNQKLSEDEVLSYTPEQENVNIYAILMYKGEEVDESKCELTLSAKKSSDVTVQNIDIVEDKFPGDYSTYTLTATVENQDDFDVTIVWTKGDDTLGTGETIFYKPTTSDEQTIVAYIEYNNQPLPNSRFEKTFVANQSETAYVSDVLVTEHKKPGQYSDYTFLANVQNDEGFDVDIVWQVGNTTLSSHEISITYTPEKDESNLTAYLTYKDQKIQNSDFSTTLTFKKSNVAKVSKITKEEILNGPNEFNSLLFTAQVDNKDNFDVVVVWTMDDEVVGQGTTFEYNPNQTATKNIQAYLVFEGEKVENSEKALSFATFKNEISIQEIEVEEIKSGINQNYSYTLTAIVNNPYNLINYEIRWYVDGELLGSGNTIEFTPTSLKQKNISAQLYLNNQTSQELVANYSLKPQKDNSLTILIIVVVFVVAIGVAIAVIFIRKYKKSI